MKLRNSIYIPAGDRMTTSRFSGRVSGEYRHSTQNAQADPPLQHMFCAVWHKNKSRFSGRHSKALGVMSARISTTSAIWLGILIVNGPVLFLLWGPLFVFGQLVEGGAISRSYNWLGLLVFGAGFVLAWLWWAVSVPKWRLWAYQRVEDIAELKARSVGVGLTWPDGHFFERTEIKSRSHAHRERELDTTARE